MEKEININWNKYRLVESEVVEEKTDWYDDLRKYIKRSWPTLEIQWEELHIYSFWIWDYYMWTHNIIWYNDKVNFKECKLSELKKWDIFIIKDYISVFDNSFINIFIWQDKKWLYRYQYINKIDWLEMISDEYYYDPDIEVIVTLRA